MILRPMLTSRSAGLVWVLSLLLLGASPVKGQVGDIFARAEFSLTVDLPETKNDTKNLLAQVDQQLQQKKWQDAIDTLERLIASHGSELIAQGRDQVDLGSEYVYYVELKTYLQRRISEYARKSPEFLDVYRSRIDALAQEEFERATQSRNPALLAAVIDNYFLSQYADDALLSLGDLLLEQGRLNEARTAWERIAPRFRTPEDPNGILLAMPGQSLWVAVDGIDWEEHRDYVRQLLNDSDSSSSLETAADSDVDPAAIWARLCLASWLEGSSERARVELKLLQQLYPQERGYLGGREVNYSDYLVTLLKSSPGELEAATKKNWPTFAGAYARTADASLPEGAETYEPNWSISLEPHSLSRGVPRNGFADEGRSRTAADLTTESFDALNSTFPIVIGEHVVVADEQRVRAFELASGLPAFPSGGSQVFERADLDYGMFHTTNRSGDFSFSMGSGRRRGSPLSAMQLKLIHALGPARFTLASNDTKLVARVGTTAIGVPYAQAQFQDPADMVVFDMRKEGKMEAKIPPVTELSGPWSFEGTAILQGERLYCGMTKSGVRDESAVACFDWTTSQMLWRRTVCLTQPYGSGLVTEGEYGFRSHNLLTLKDGVLYYNSNHGVIAALEADRGSLLWLTHYPRRDLIPNSLEQSHQQVQRNANPCLVTRGLVISMPLDSERLFALDAATGQLVWQTVPGGIDPVHLIGATEEDVLVSGEQLFWVQLHSGKIRAEFPAEENSYRDRGYGRGALVGDQVYWPTRETIFRLNIKLSGDGSVVEAAKPIDLSQFGEEGGNIVVAGGQMIVASPSRMTVYSPTQSIAPPDKTPE